MNTFRVPFRWERLQRSLCAPSTTPSPRRLSSVVSYATGRGAYVILDPHNYARYNGALVGSGSVPNSAFADFWSRLAAQYKTNSRVIFGLMNEPHDMPTEQWVAAANAAIAAIRAAGAQNLILVPGNAWTGAHAGRTTGTARRTPSRCSNIDDPINNFAFEVHQYLDGRRLGTSRAIAGATIGSQRLAGFTNWLQANGRRGFLGEFAVAGSDDRQRRRADRRRDARDMLDYIEDNADVWLGWTWWAGGPWWGEYMFTLEPQNLGQPNEADRPQLAVLQPHLLPEPASALWAGVIAVTLLQRRQRRHSGS